MSRKNIKFKEALGKLAKEIQLSQKEHTFFRETAVYAEMLCREANLKSEKGIEYHVLQFEDMVKDQGIVWKIAEFYDKKWTGHPDFMHTPEKEDVLRNLKKYPIVVALKDGKIKAISTLKFDTNIGKELNPYFPKKNVDSVSITGILTDKDPSIKGLGKQIYKIMYDTIGKYQETHPEAKTFVEIDCRNINSFKALRNADKDNRLGVVGYYLIKNKNGEIVEAPTLVISDISSKNMQTKNETESEIVSEIVSETESEIVSEIVSETEKELDYSSYNDKLGISLNDFLAQKMMEGFKKNGEGIQENDGENTVLYFTIEEVTLSHVKIEKGKTAKGNRAPKLKDSQIPEHWVTFPGRFKRSYTAMKTIHELKSEAEKIKNRVTRGNNEAIEI